MFKYANFPSCAAKRARELCKKKPQVTRLKRFFVFTSDFAYILRPSHFMHSIYVIYAVAF